MRTAYARAMGRLAVTQEVKHSDAKKVVLKTIKLNWQHSLRRTTINHLWTEQILITPNNIA